MVKRKKILLVSFIALIGAVVLAAAVLLFAPLKATFWNASLRKAAQSQIVAVTVVTEPCCGKMEGPRVTYTRTDAKFLAAFKNAAQSMRVKKDFALFRVGGSHRTLTAVDSAGNTFYIKFEQGGLDTVFGKYAPTDHKLWQFLYDYPEDAEIETEY